MSNSNQIPTELEDYEPQSIKQFQTRDIDRMDKDKAEKLATEALVDIDKASGPKDILKIMATVVNKIPAFIPFLMLALLMGCSGQRPPSITSTHEYKTSLLEEAIADKTVRDDAHIAAFKSRETRKISSMYARDLTRANNVEMQDGKPFVVYVSPAGKKYTEPLSAYIQRIVTLRDEAKAKLDARISEEQIEDAKITEKLLAVAKLDAIEERYQQKVEAGAVSADDVSVFIDDIAETIVPLLRKDETKGKKRKR